MTDDLEAGEVFSAEVNMVARNGLASVKHGHTTISIGPVTCEKGTLVHIKYIGEEKVNENTTANFGLCLTEHVLSEGYHEYVGNIIGHLTPDEPPDSGEVMYAKVDEIEGRDLGVADLGGRRVQLGPVCATEGDIVQISGVDDTAAEVLTESAKGDQYEIRFNILTGRTNRLPISVGEEYSAIITNIENETPIAQVMGVPILFPNETAGVGQKVDLQITGFERDRAVGKILKKYDEVARVENLGHWGRMQWLRKVGFGAEPFRNFAAEFLDVNSSSLPQNEKGLRAAVIAEAIRLCLEEKATHSDDEFPRAHITGIRHWVTHKLSTILGDPDDEDDWFREVLTDGRGQTLTFLGDVLELSEGYYAMSPSRATMTSETEAILISGRSTRYLKQLGLDIELRGITRRATNTSEGELEEAGLLIQSLSAYLDMDGVESFDGEYLTEFIETRRRREWAPEEEWEPYAGTRGYGFDWDDGPLRVQTAQGEILSLWRVPVEYGADEYQLRVEPSAEEGSTHMVRVPSRLHKQVCLALDAMSGRAREIEFAPAGDESRISCTFAPPRAQMRWLYAVGARWEEPRNGKLHWRVDPVDLRSIEDSFNRLAVTINNRTSELSH